METFVFIFVLMKLKLRIFNGVRPSCNIGVQADTSQVTVP